MKDLVIKSLFLAVFFLKTAVCHAQDNNEFFLSVIKRDTSKVASLLAGGQDPNLVISKDHYFELSPLGIAVGLGDHNMEQLLLRSGAKLGNCHSDLIIASMFSRGEVLRDFFNANTNQQAGSFLQYLVRGIQPSHFRTICDTLNNRLVDGTPASELTYDWLAKLRRTTPDAPASVLSAAIMSVLPFLQFDQYNLVEMENIPGLLDELAPQNAFVAKIAALPICDKHGLLTDTLFRNKDLRQVLFKTIKSSITGDPSCFTSLFAYYLPKIIKEGDIPRFREFQKGLLEPSAPFNARLHVLSEIEFSEDQVDMIEALMESGLHIGYEDGSPYFNFSYLAMNPHKNAFRDRLFSNMLARLEKDTAVLNATYQLSSDERFVKALIEKGADPERDLDRKLIALSISDVNAETMAYILSKCRILNNIEKSLEFITNRLQLQTIKHAILRTQLVNTSIARRTRDQIEAIRLQKLEDIRKSIHYQAEIFMVHYKGGTTPTKLVENEPLKFPSQRNPWVSAEVTKSRFTSSGESGELPTSYPQIRYNFSMGPFTAQYDQLRIGNVNIIKKGDKFFFKGFTEVTIPRISFDPGNELFFPSANIHFYVKDKATRIILNQNGKDSVLKISDQIDVDLSHGDTKIRFEDMKGFNVIASMDMSCELKYLPDRERVLKDQISSDFFEEARIRNYAALYSNTIYSKYIPEQKAKAISTNILSNLMFAEKYPEYILDQLKDAYSRVITIDNSLNKFRQFYILNRRITAKNIPALQLALAHLKISSIQDEALRNKLERLSSTLQQHAQENEIMSQYLEVFSSQYFEDLSYEIQRYQGFVLELAQFMSDEDLIKAYSRRSITVPLLKSKILPVENIVENEYLGGRGGFLRTLISN